MIRNCFEDEVDVKGRLLGGHDAHDNDRGLCRDQTVLMGHVADEKMRDGESLDRLAVAKVVDAIVDCRLPQTSGFAVMPLSDLLRPLLQARLKLTVSKSARMLSLNGLPFQGQGCHQQAGLGTDFCSWDWAIVVPGQTSWLGSGENRRGLVWLVSYCSRRF